MTQENKDKAVAARLQLIGMMHAEIRTLKAFSGGLKFGRGIAQSPLDDSIKRMEGVLEQLQKVAI